MYLYVVYTQKSTAITKNLEKNIEYGSSIN